MNVYIYMVLLTFGIGLILSKPLIPFLRNLNASQTEREELKSHKKKEGTPTMGGFIFIVAITIVSFIFIKYAKDSFPALFLAIGFGIIGFLDDYLKVVLHRSDGLIAWQKFLLQFVICAGFIFYLYKTFGEVAIIIPFTGGYEFSFGILTIPFLFFVIVGTVNGVNFTDGLDGLSSSVTLVVTCFFAAASFLLNQSQMALPVIVAGGLMAFLAVNVYPAKTFMGDTGSLFLGGYVAGMAILLKLPLFILIVGFIYLIEVLSVIIQVTYFKKTKGKRIFKMAPIHHHFELSGFSETRIVYLFSLVTAVLSLIGILGVR